MPNHPFSTFLKLTPGRKAALAGIIALFLSVPVHAQSFDAVTDTLSATTAGLTFHPIERLLPNDVVDPGDSLRFEVLDLPQNGTLDVLPDGSVRYIPAPGFVGRDRFSYRWETIPIQRLVVDPSVSVLSFDATLQTDLGASDASEEIAVDGVIMADLGGDPAVLDSVHVTGLELTNRGNHSLRFDYGSPISIGSLRIVVDAGNVMLSMMQAGPKSATSGVLNTWQQPDNLVDVAVTATLEGSGLLSGQVPDEAQQLETQTLEGLSGAVFMSGEQVLFLLTVQSTNTFDLEGSSVDLSIDGSLQANAVFESARSSSEAEVIVNVASGASVDGPATSSLSSMDVFPNPVSDSVTLKWKAGLDSGPFEIRVYDLLGREVADVVSVRGHDEMSARLNASNWSPGLYIVRVSGRTSTAVRTFLRH